MIVLSICDLLSVSFAVVCASAFWRWWLISGDACCISAVISECHIAYNTVSHVYYFYILGGVIFTYVVSTTRCIYTCPVSSGMRPRPPPEVFWAIGLYYKIHEVTRCKQPLYIFFMLFFIKMKLSSRLCLTHKRVTQKYRNSKLKKQNKKKSCPRIGSDRIGIGDTQNFLDRIGSDLKKWYRCIPNSRYRSNVWNN